MPLTRPYGSITLSLTAMLLRSPQSTLDTEMEFSDAEKEADHGHEAGHQHHGFVDLHSKQARGYLRAIYFGIWIQVRHVLALAYERELQ